MRQDGVEPCEPGPANALYLRDRDGTRVGRLSRRAEEEWQARLTAVREVRVVAMLHRGADQDADEERRLRYRVDEWEVPLVEVVSDSGTPDIGPMDRTGETD